MNWSGIASSRFRGRDPALQALDFVRQHGVLSADQRKLLEGRFPITTLDRLLSTPGVRSRIGVEVAGGKLLTALPAEEAIKPLRRIVLDLAEKKMNVTKLKSKGQQTDYVAAFAKADLPDLTRTSGKLRSVEVIEEREFAPPASSAQPAKPTRAPARTSIVPRSCKLNVTVAKLGEIYAELRALRLNQHPHSIAVLLRVFLETSVDHYLTKVGVTLVIKTCGGGDKDKNLAKKVEDAIDHLVANGATRKDFTGVVRSLSVRAHPLSVDLLHAYVHNRFVSPTERDLTTAWDSAQPLFERIWS